MRIVYFFQISFRTLVIALKQICINKKVSGKNTVFKIKIQPLSNRFDFFPGKVVIRK